MRNQRFATLLTAVTLATLPGCDVLDDPEIQPLPALSRPSPESRIGLPEIMGEWSFAGWDLAIADSGAALGGLPAPGELQIQTQRLDSLAGVYRTEAGQAPLVGEVRRDGVVALIIYDAAGQGSFLAGQLRSDTLWIELTSLPVAEAWPPGTRTAFVRDSVRGIFARLPGGVVLRSSPDTTAAPPADSAAPVRAPLNDTARATVPAPTRAVRPDTSAARAPRRQPPPATDTAATPEPERAPPAPQDTTPAETIRVPLPDTPVVIPPPV